MLADLPDIFGYFGDYERVLFSMNQRPGDCVENVIDTQHPFLNFINHRTKLASGG